MREGQSVECMELKPRVPPYTVLAPFIYFRDPACQVVRLMLFPEQRRDLDLRIKLRLLQPLRLPRYFMVGVL